DLRVSGTLGLAGLEVGDAETRQDFGAAWKDLDVGIRELTLRGLLGEPVPRVALALAQVRLAEPSVQVTRTAQGMVIPALGPAAAPEPAAAASSAPAPPATGTAVPVAPAEAGAAASEPPLGVEIDEVRVEGGRAQILDRSLRPFF